MTQALFFLSCIGSYDKFELNSNIFTGEYVNSLFELALQNNIEFGFIQGTAHALNTKKDNDKFEMWINIQVGSIISISRKFIVTRKEDNLVFDLREYYGKIL